MIITSIITFVVFLLSKIWVVLNNFVGILDFIILAALTITSIITFAVLLYVNRSKRIKDIGRKAKLGESYIFDLGNRIFTILNRLTLFNLFRHFFGRDLPLFEIDATPNIEEKLKEGSIPNELNTEFEKKELPLPANAKVFAYNSNQWRIPAEKSPYGIKKECGKIKISRVNYFFVDSWVLGNLLLTIPIFWFWASIPDQLKYIAIILGALRVYEPPLYGIKVVLFDPEKAKRRPVRLNAYRSLILTLMGYFNIIIWFAIFYRFIGLDSRFASLNFSFHTMTTFGNIGISPASDFGPSIVFLQSVIGFIMVLVIIAALISDLPRLRHWEDEAEIQ